tara:strand:- start:221 stop:1204 length:984 start_codon:yes stop_codon:yes gene_type:complete
MIKKNFEIDKIDASLGEIFLFYGINEGAKKEKINSLLQKVKVDNIYNYDEKQITENEVNFLDHIFSKSLFEDKKYIIINRATDKIEKIINNILGKNIKDIALIINCGVLDKKSKLRKLFENEEKLLCAAFYEDTLQSLTKLSIKFFHENKISISQSDLNLIIDRCNGDRSILKSELNKIKFYSLSKKKLNSETILKLTNLSENHSISELIQNCLAKNQKKVIKILNENNFSADDCILLLRFLLSKAKNLALLCSEYNKTKNLDMVIRNSKPPIFWKDKEITKHQINNWENRDIKKFIYEIVEHEFLIKKNIVNPVNLVSNFLIEKSS